MAKSFKVLILGAGSGGISMAARLAKKISPAEIAILDPAEDHFYQPMWTLVGAGQAKKESTRKSIDKLVPTGITRIKDSAVQIDPEKNKVLTATGTEINYDFLIVAIGLRLAWEKIIGLPEALGKNNIDSIYEYEQVDGVWRSISNFQGGKMIFVMPPVPIKCAGAPQKIMYLAEDILRSRNIREKTDIHFFSAGKAMFGIPVFAEALQKIVDSRDIKTHFQRVLKEVDGAAKRAKFLYTREDGSQLEEWQDFDFLHVVPPMEAPSIIKNTDLAHLEGDQKGWLAVNKNTLQHLKYPNIFGIGDITGVPNSKTGAAIRMQAPILTENLLAAMEGRDLKASYDGYSSCPITTEIGKVMLAEFGYDSKLLPTFPLNPAVPRRSYWYLKKLLLPRLYWQGMLKGRA